MVSVQIKTELPGEVKMGKCPHFEKCPFFNNKMSGMPIIAKQLQDKYCNEEYVKCARFMINKMFIEGYAPKDEQSASEFEKEFDKLFPNNIDKAEKIIVQLVK